MESLESHLTAQLVYIIAKAIPSDKKDL